MKFNQNDTDALLNLLSWRRDVRHFETTPIPDADIEQLLHAIDLAPSVGNSRPWRFVRVISDDLKMRVYENFKSSNASAADVYSDDELDHYTNLKLAGLKEAPLHLAVFTELNPELGKGLGRQTMPETLIYSTVIAIHNLWLAARTMNIGVGWVSILKPNELNTMLDVPNDWQFTGYLCLGYPKFNTEEPELHQTSWQKNVKTGWIER
ncbi:MAG: 5,6-dimethylbenzimidazole synthase [Lentilitoribacter sp.]